MTMPNGSLPIVRTSERSAFKRCPQKWWWEYRMGLTSRGETPDALWFGIGTHLALAAWYRKGKKRGTHPATTFARWVGDEIRYVRANYSERDKEWYDEPLWQEAAELGVAMLEGYVDKYGKDLTWDVIAIEHPFKVRVIREGQPVAIFASTWDGVYRDEEDGGIYLMEHKTAGQISLPYLELDDQAGAYWAVATAVCRERGWLKPNETIAGITYNFLRKSMPDERPQNEHGEYLNKDGTVSKKQPPPKFVREQVERAPQELRSQMERLADQVTIMNGMRAGTIPIVKNTTRDCTWCQFFDMCKLHERGGDAWRQFARAEFTVRDPYADTRKSAGW
jgi:Zierdtviridae exonuclease